MRTGKWNPGGGRWLEVIPIDHVSGFVRVGSAVPTYAILPGHAWIRIYCTEGTLKYQEDPVSPKPDNGDLYDLLIEGFSPDDTKPKGATIDELQRLERVLVRFCDNQGLIRMAGSPTEYVSFSFQFGTDADIAGSRGYVLKLASQTTQRAAYVS
jgi:hypothetical protein